MSQNPFEPGAPLASATPSAAQPPSTPTVLIVFGVLNIIFGVMGLCGSVFAIIEAVVPQPEAGANPIADAMHESQAYTMINTISSGLGFIFAIVLLVSGILLLRRNPMGRTLALVYVVYAFISVLVGLGSYFVLVHGPMMEAIGAEGGPEAQAVQVAMFVGIGVGVCFGLGYPIVLLIFMLSERVKRALGLPV